MLWEIYSAIYGEVNISVEKCVEIKGDCVENQQSCFIPVTLKSWSGRKLLDPTTHITLVTVYGTDSFITNFWNITSRSAWASRYDIVIYYCVYD